MSTSKEVRGEGIDGVIGSSIGDFDDSPLSNFVEERVSFLLGAMERVFESLKKMSDTTVHKIRKVWNAIGKGRFTCYMKEMRYNAFVI